MKTPFLGCAYYPEDWDESEIPYDIAKMKEAGITCARIGEFAWKKMEPREGEYDFSWLHKVVNALHEAGIAVVMGTPTATPPHWLLKKYPEIPVLRENGTRASHGGRRHGCSNNPDYLAYCDKIVRKMGEEFGSDPAIIGWQIDNEIYTWDTGCLCPHCMKAFHDRLREQYGTVEEVNRRWNLNLFSQAYEDIDDIPAPVGTWHNPHIKYEWTMAHHDADRRFVHRQNDILRQYTTAPIGTDMMPLNGLDYETVTAPLDVVQFNHYNTPENMTDCVFWFDFLRTLKDRPFWNTETQTTHNGSTDIHQKLQPEGWCRLNSWLPAALGGEANMYWLWRQHWAGHELIHGSVLTPAGKPVHVFGEVQQTAREFAAASDFLTATKVKTPVALHYTSKSWTLFEKQAIVSGMNYTGEATAFHRALSRSGVRPDVIGAMRKLDGYKVLFSPFIMSLEDNGLAERIRAWVEEGGVWVCGPMTDIRNEIGAHFTDYETGILEEMLGAVLDYSVADDGTTLKAAWSDGKALAYRRFAECWTLPENGEVLASVTAGHSALNGETLIGKVKLGKGTVILLGTIPSDEDLDKLVSLALAEADVQPYRTEGSLLVIPREGDGVSGLILCEIGNSTASVVLEGAMTDLLTGTTYEAGTMQVMPYGIHVLVPAK